MDYSDLYDTLMGMNEQRKKDNFNAFMNGLNAGLVEDLNKAFQCDKCGKTKEFYQKYTEIGEIN